MKTGLRPTSRVVLCAVLVAASIPMVAQAAKVNATLSYESGDYGSDYDYAGPRLDMNINPDGSNWYFDLGYRNRTHDSKQVYTRAEIQAAYRFRFDGGWIQPSAKVRQDVTSYDSGSRLTNDIYSSETKYIFDLSDKWTLWGEAQFGLERQEDKNVSGTVRNSDYLAWEVEPGIRYNLTAKQRLTLSYYNTGKRSDKGETWGLTDHTYNQQARLYYYWDTPIGLVISPYVRYALGYGETSAWYDSAYHDETKTQSKVSRYAIQLAYPLTDYLRIQAEYYIEDVEYKEGFTMGKEDSQVKYLKLGARVSF
ncbi:hypothetical protein RJ45_12340 [Photobacterium gaetbulicola]|uniref:Porin n=1 Tax=Photobacterium gaetbulicola TaxID=1295392 RepID=A0A0B9H3C7_9GAMM|nr:MULTISPECIES: OmpG porin family protein [Photobacterium]KHT63392.1 hypothetical protein RJ45_12340 [Photobacterium gaetbulicola]WEM43678.1 OmpG porin family protein [Photobacterium sp. DA100]